MSEIQLPAWLATIIGVGLPALGWFGRQFIERRWKRRDRMIGRAEANLEAQHRLLRDLNGDLYQKWLWLADHPDAVNHSRAEPVANEVGTWLYKHSAYFPEDVRLMLVNLGHLTFHLATDQRGLVLQQYREKQLPAAWAHLRDYQRKVEKKLGLEDTS